MKKLTLPGNWRGLLRRGVIPLVTVAGILVIVFDWDTLPPKWRESGLGKDKEISTSIEKDAKGRILKITTTEKSQSAKTIWDWLGPAGTLALPGALFWFGLRQQRRDQQQDKLEKERAQQQDKLEREIAATNLREEALQAYFDRMAELLVDRNPRSELLSTGQSDNPVKDVARIRTVTILRMLEGDQERQAIVLHFLRDAELLKFLLSRANLEGVNLERANLMEANLERARLMKANLKGARLMEANLEGASLMEANLEGANLHKAVLLGASLWNTNLEGACLMQANLVNAMLTNARLVEAKLWKANLTQAVLLGAILEGAILEGANLEGANLEGANLKKAKNLTSNQVKAARNWEKAYYSPEFCQQLGLPPNDSKKS